MHKFRDLFPLGKAYGAAFCNRVKEVEELTGNILSGKHTLLIAVRRYGKSSLAEKAIQKTELPAIRVNFHLCTTDTEIADLILDNVVKLIGTAVGKVEQIIENIKQYLLSLEPSIVFGDVASLKLIPKKQVNPSVVVAEALLLVEKLLKERNKRAVIFFDEFQEIAKVNKHHNMEGAIRTAAQEMQHVSIIFSGSIRSMLLSMFEDENRPLYKLCRKIKLDRIGMADYEKHIQKIAQKTWHQRLPLDVFERIIFLSGCHPYYINYLCDILWQQCDDLPTPRDVELSWQKVVEEEWRDALKEIASLPLGQRRLLKYLSISDGKNIHGQETSKLLSMAPSSIGTAANVLLEKDYIEQDVDKSYRVINPLLLAVLKGAED